jgi:hypothetical protein
MGAARPRGDLSEEAGYSLSHELGFATIWQEGTEPISSCLSSPPGGDIAWRRCCRVRYAVSVQRNPKALPTSV